MEGAVTWADDYTSVTISSLICDICGNMTHTVLRADENGNNVETTVYSLDVLNEDDTIQMALDEAGTIVCTNIESEATGVCDEGLTTTYTAYGPEGSDYEGVVMATIAVLQEPGMHNFVADDDAWTWIGNDEDGYSAAMLSEATCSICGETVENLEAVVTSETAVEATCTSDGTTIYTAKVTVTDDGGNEIGFVSTSKTVTVSATGHDFDEETGECRNGCGLTDLSIAGTMSLSYDSATYDGEVLEPEVTVTTAAGTELTEGTDYEVTYENNDTLGTATVTVTGTGNTYVGTLTKTFTINLAKGNVTKLVNDKSGMTITWDKVKGAEGYYVYRKTSGDSYEKIDTITSGSTLTYTETANTVGKSGTTYTYCVRPYYTDSTGTIVKGGHEAGKSKMRLDNCTVSLTKTTSGITVNWNEVKGATGYIVYYKTNKSGSTEYRQLAKITDGSTTSYKHTASKTTGAKYTYKVVAYYKKNSSSSTIKSSFTAKSTIWVSPVSISSLTNSSSKKMTVKWSKNSKATGYQIQYSTSSSFSDYTTVWVRDSSTVSKTISNLTKGKTYYVRIRAYYKNSSGTKYFSAWSSSTKSVKISK